jgi:membrane protein YqaA with SNARE-associated domain
VSRTFRAAELWLIAGAMAAVSVGLWLIGAVLDIELVKFAGFMFGASTFVPLPADAYLLNVAADHNPVAIGVIGGAVNAAAVLGEREWLLRLTAHPFFGRFKEFVGTNRWVDAMANERYLFVGLVVGGFSFLPFEPFRLVAVLRNYSPLRYALATFLGRGFRYYWLARAGGVLAVYGVVRWVVWGSLALFAYGLVRSYQRYRATGH